MNLGQKVAADYSTCVLFPETLIQLLQVKGGKTRQLAEQSFMEIVVDQEERECLKRDIEEAAERLREEKEEREEDSGDEWMDHSDIEDSL